MPTLAIYLDAPLQSWGASSKYQYRETGSFPTKSALLGILAAALGIDKHDPHEAQALAPLIALNLTVVKLLKNQQSPTRLMDFHTVGGGFDWRAAPRDRLSIPPKASGAPFGTVITRRSYLTDALYALTAAVTCSMGFLPQLGFVHQAGTLPFIYDIADLYKYETSWSAAFEAASLDPNPRRSLVRQILKRNIEESRMLRRMPNDLKKLFEDLPGKPPSDQEPHPLQPTT